MFSVAASVFLVGIVGTFAQECSNETKDHARSFVEGKCGTLDDFMKFAKCKTEAGTDIKAAVDACSEELGIGGLEQLGGAYQYICKQEDLEKKVQLVCCAITKAMAQRGHQLSEQILEDKVCLKEE